MIYLVLETLYGIQAVAVAADVSAGADNRPGMRDHYGNNLQKRGMRMSENITRERLEQLQEKCRADKSCRVAMNAVTENGLWAAAKNGEAQTSE